MAADGEADIAAAVAVAGLVAEALRAPMGRGAAAAFLVTVRAGAAAALRGFFAAAFVAGAALTCSATPSSSRTWFRLRRTRFHWSTGMRPASKAWRTSSPLM